MSKPKVYPITNLKGVEVVVNNHGENFEKGLKRFKRMCNNEGVLQDLREKESFEKPSDKRRRRRRAAIKRCMDAELDELEKMDHHG